MTPVDAIDRGTAAEMYDALSGLDAGARKSLIADGLRTSPRQFAWSLYAIMYGVPASEWPEYLSDAG